MRISNKDARGAVEARQHFTGSNTFGEWTQNSKSRDKVYVVYSYGVHFPMYAYEGGHWYENVDKYSVSTSKQQTQLRPHGVELTPMDTGSMNRIAESGIAGLAAMGKLGEVK